MYQIRVLRPKALMSPEEIRKSKENDTFDMTPEMAGVDGITSIVGEWPVDDDMNKQIKVVDLDTGNIIGEIGFKSTLPRIERLQVLKADLLKIHEVKKTLGDQTDRLDSLTPSECTEKECSIEKVGFLLEDQYQRVVNAAAPGKFEPKVSVPAAKQTSDQLKLLQSIDGKDCSINGTSCCKATK